MTLTRKQLIDMGHNDITAGAELQAFIDNTDKSMRVYFRRIGESIQSVQRSEIK